MSNIFAVLAPKIFDGHKWQTDAALIVNDKHVEQISPISELPKAIKLIDLGQGIISPGFVDLQVNGGGGVLLNNDPSVDGIRKICAAHAQFGTTSLFPTLITDSNNVRNTAIAAAIEARKQNITGFAGLHLEGPHLCVARKGAHDKKYIRPMLDEDVEILLEAQSSISSLIVTLAAESVTPKQVKMLSDAGIKISLGHCDAGVDQINPLLDAGAIMFTHLFNAMSQMKAREPGMVGAALGTNSYASIIADGYHVHPQSIINALAAKKAQQGKIFLISDAMSFVGTNAQELVLNNRKISRHDGRLSLEDGTLAGADIEMASAVRYMHKQIQLELAEALRMATIYPCSAAGLDNVGDLLPGSRADFVWLNENLQPQATWVEGQKI